MLHTEFSTEEQIAEGKPQFFDLDLYLKAVEQMITCEEVTNALHMLDNVPAWYREFGDPRIDEVRRSIMRTIAMPAQYSAQSNEDYDGHQKLAADNNWAKVEEQIYAVGSQPRGPMLLALVKGLNDLGFTPHIIEFGPSNFWFAYGLRAQRCKFTYFAYTLNKAAELTAREQLKDIWSDEITGNPYIYVCCEVIEHLTNIDDVRIYSEKQGRSPDFVLLSAPRNCYLGGRADWRNNVNEHLRTFTPQELGIEAKRMWPKLQWESVVTLTTNLLGKRIR